MDPRIQEIIQNAQNVLNLSEQMHKETVEYRVRGNVIEAPHHERRAITYETASIAKRIIRLMQNLREIEESMQ